LCPFHVSTCFKQSRLLEVPFGVCTVHTDELEIALCPRRFLEGNIVSRDIAQSEFGTCDDILVFSEIGLRGIGNFDFVMVRHRPLSAEVEDFTVIEFQTGQTTSTGKLVDGFKDFLIHGTFAEGANYGFGINNYDIWKRTFTQVLNKGIILEKWRTRIYWVVQQPIFDYFHHKYRLGDLTFNEKHSTVFASYDLCHDGSKLRLTSTAMKSSTIDSLFDAFRKNEDIPPVENFIERLERKLRKDVHIGLRLDMNADRWLDKE